MEGNLTRRELLARTAAIPLALALPASAKAVATPKAKAPEVEPVSLTWQPGRDGNLKLYAWLPGRQGNLKSYGSKPFCGWEAWTPLEEWNWRHGDWTSPVFREFAIAPNGGWRLTNRRPERPVWFRHKYNGNEVVSAATNAVAAIYWGDHACKVTVPLVDPDARPEWTVGTVTLSEPFVVGGNSIAELAADVPGQRLRKPDRIDFLLFAERT